MCDVKVSVPGPHGHAGDDPEAGGGVEAGEGHRQGHEDSPHLAAAADIEILTPGDYVALCALFCSGEIKRGR